MVVVETILFKFIANMGEFNILIANDKHQIASFAIEGVNTSIIMKKSYTAIKATLKDLNIFDCNPKSIHNKVSYTVTYFFLINFNCNIKLFYRFYVKLLMKKMR